ncbi:MAG: DUF4160 domain-containing protein [Gemmatimonadales bacterium]|nr:DUF4160 domain-containing protein [Gemmatimonadales bacterium]
MPVVFRQGNVVVRIYPPPREHHPPHVHVCFVGIGEVVIELGTAVAGPRIHRDYGVPARMVLAAYHIVADHQELFQHEWEKLHGTPPTD